MNARQSAFAERMAFECANRLGSALFTARDSLHTKAMRAFDMAFRETYGDDVSVTDFLDCYAEFVGECRKIATKEGWTK